MPDYIVLGSNHKWFACYNWNQVIEFAKEMFKNGCDYVKVIRFSEVTHWTKNDIKI